jgi:zinc-ribbon domain
MLCPQCGSELPDDARSCSKCRYNFALATAPPAISTDTATQEQQFRKLLIVAFLLLVGIAVGLWATMRSSLPFSSGSLWSARENPEVTLPIVATSQNLKGKEYVSYVFVVPASFKSARVDGNFAVSTTPSAGVEVFIADAASFGNWKNHHPAAILYNSGRVNQARLNVPIPAGKTQYYLVVNNAGSSRPQAVQVDVKLHYRP